MYGQQSALANCRVSCTVEAVAIRLHSPPLCHPSTPLLLPPPKCKRWTKRQLAQHIHPFSGYEGNTTNPHPAHIFFSWLIQSLKFFPSILWWNGMSKIHRKRACSPVFSQIAFSLEFESQSQIEGFWMGQPYIHNSFSLCASSGTTDGIKSGISKEMWWVNRIRIGERRVWWFCSSVPHSAIRLKNRTFRISWRHIYQLSIYFRVDKLCQQIRRYFSTFLTNGGI